MAVFPDLGSWLLGSVRRDNVAGTTPVLAIKRLQSLPRPLQDADKEALVGAVLTMSSSLNLALGMLQELLPQEESQKQLGEVLCPTLGYLLTSLQSTLSSFEWKVSGSVPVHRIAQSPTAINTPEKNRPCLSNDASQRQAPRRHSPTLGGSRHEDPGAASAELEQVSQQSRPQAEIDLRGQGALQDGVPSPGLHIDVDTRNRPESHLVKALQAERRVQAAIHVAIESLEFAEGQLKLVKQVNQIHGGSFDLIQRQFYAGYDRLVLRALELQRQELGLLQDRDSLISAPSVQRQTPQPPRDPEAQPILKQHHSVSFESRRPSTSPLPTLPGAIAAHPAYPDRRPLGRRNTIQGIRQEDCRTTRPRPSLKRRLSLAEELAMVGEDSESGYQEETSEMASSDSEDSAAESGNESLDLTGMENESEEYSSNNESVGQAYKVADRDDEDDDNDDVNDDDDDMGEQEDGDEKTLDVADLLGRSPIALNGHSANHARSRLPRPLQVQSRR